MVKNIYILIIMFMLSISCVSAIEFSSDQDDNLGDYYMVEKGNTLVNNIAGSVNEQFVSSTNNTYYYDTSYEFEETNKAYYLIIQNAQVDNTTMRIMWRGDLTKDPTLYVQNFTLNERGRYYFKFTPSNIGEVSKVYLDFEDSFASTIRYVEEKPRSFNDLVGNFVSGLTEIKDINIALWKITFYVFLFVISTGFIFGMFYIAFKIFAIAREIRDKKGLMSNAMYDYRDTDNKRDKRKE